MEGAISCTNCGGRPWHLSTIIPACRYEGAVQGLIQRFKYGRDIALARPLGILLARSLDDERLAGCIFDALVPVPLHPRRRRERGFNQAELLAARLSRVAGIPVRRLIRRSRATPPQAGFDRVERMENLRDAFALRRPIPSGGVFLLVDDVSTTGATLDACAAVLREGGASEVFAVVVARGSIGDSNS
jgi:ComF family protein